MIAKETDEIILFHSLSGKDSIAMLDLCYPHFKRIVCVYMYVVKDLEHIMRYYRWAKQKYPNIEFLQVPHYGVYSYIKAGFMGCKKNPKQRLWNLSDITEKVRQHTGIEWVCCGFKQSDSLNRRLMLRSYNKVYEDGTPSLEAINWESKKFYPLSTYKNGDVLDYIAYNHLKEPETYGGKGQSVGTDITGFVYLDYLRQNFPNDLEKIFKEYPMTRIVLLDADKEKYQR